MTPGAAAPLGAQLAVLALAAGAGIALALGVEGIARLFVWFAKVTHYEGDQR